MSKIPSNVGGATAQNPFGDNNSLNELDISDFLDLMIAELQNQDPLNPLDNAELIAQIGQIRSVGATDKLTETLDSVLLGQNVTSATSLIGQEVKALSNDNKVINGIVNRITISEGLPEIHIDTVTQAKTLDEDGSLEAGAYQYKVVYDKEDGSGKAAVELGPISTTGVNGLDTAIEISNLPESEGPKQIFRTNKTGTGDYFLLGSIPDGRTAIYIDNKSDKELSSTTLTYPTTKEFGGRKFSAKLSNVSEITNTK